jgi:hypothetical protein
MAYLKNYHLKVTLFIKEILFYKLLINIGKSYLT